MPKVDTHKQLYILATKHFDVDPQNILDDIIHYHLKIKPEALTKQGLEDILDWLEITSYLVIKDSKQAKSFITKAKDLSGKKDA